MSVSLEMRNHFVRKSKETSQCKFKFGFGIQFPSERGNESLRLFGLSEEFSNSDLRAAATLVR